MPTNALEKLEWLGWLKRKDNTRVVLSVPGFGDVRFSRAHGAAYGALQLPPGLTESFHRQFALVNGMWDWAQFESFARWLLETCLTETQRTCLSDAQTLEESLRREPITETTAAGRVRQFQNELRDLLLRMRGQCEISGVRDAHLLVASHILPWSECKRDGMQRLDIENVLLLAANWDALFDKFYISFEPETGKMIKSRRIDDAALAKFGVPSDWRESVRVDVSGARRRKYLNWHNERMELLDQVVQ